jgi:Ca2+:H+ antiporter
MGVLFPTVLSSSGYESHEGLLGLSRATSLILFSIYGCYLYFQLHSHKHLYENSPSDKLPDAVISRMHREDVENQPTNGAVTSAPASEDKATVDSDDEEEDELGFYNALIWLAIITAFIAVLSEAISDSIQNAADSANVSGVFIASILLPIVGNAAEHAGAIVFATKGKVDLTLGVAIGSSTQIALCVLPLLVIIAWMCNKDLTLDFGGFEGASLFFSVVAVTFVIKDGTANWLLGAALIGAYFIIACAFWAHLNEPLDSSR